MYDIARTVGDPAIWMRAGHRRRGWPGGARSSRAAPSWTERHPVLVWAALAALVLLLGAITWRALRAAGDEPPMDAAGDKPAAQP